MNVFLAGGIGVTLFVSAIRHFERNGRSNYILHWSSRAVPSLVNMIAPAIGLRRVCIYDARHQQKPSIAEIVAKYEGCGFAACCGQLPMIEIFENLVGSRSLMKESTSNSSRRRSAPRAHTELYGFRITHQTVH
jgi:ferredoxin-NADP reductase